MPDAPQHGNWEDLLDDPHEALYTVGVVAELMGVDPQVVRGYDQRGLVEPGRSVNGQRRYSREDIRRLSRAMTLADEGIPSAGIERILDLEGQLADRAKSSSQPRGAEGAADPNPQQDGDESPQPGHDRE